jgi:integrase
MLYVLAAWTGYRRQELASLTRSSFKFNTTPAKVTVTAAYSKRRRQDVIPLHTEVAARVKTWLATKKDLAANQPVFDLRAARWRASADCLDDETRLGTGAPGLD